MMLPATGAFSAIRSMASRSFFERFLMAMKPPMTASRYPPADDEPPGLSELRDADDELSKGWQISAEASAKTSSKLRNYLDQQDAGDDERHARGPRSDRSWPS